MDEHQVLKIGRNRRFLVGLVLVSLVLVSLLGGCTRERVVVIERPAPEEVAEDEESTPSPAPSPIETPELELDVVDAYDPIVMRQDFALAYRCVFFARPEPATTAYYVDYTKGEVQDALDRGASVKHARLRGQEAMLREFLSTPGVRGAIRDVEQQRTREEIRYGTTTTPEPIECMYAILDESDL